MRKDYKIDDRRIYAVGHSNGARFVNVLWRLRGKQFAAFCSAAAQGGLMIRDAVPRSLFALAGEQDPLVPYAGQTLALEVARQVLKTDETKAVTKGYLRTVPGTQASPTDISEKKALEPAVLKQAVEKALQGRKSIHFSVVPTEAEAELTIDTEVNGFTFSETDPVDMLVGVGAAALDAATIDLRATIHAAWALLTHLDAEALCVQRDATGSSRSTTLGVITRDDILRGAGVSG